MSQIKVLDKGFVELIDSMGSDLSVVNSARVSFGKRKETFEESDAKLIKYLAEHKHSTPFRHAFATLHIKCPLFVKGQFDKHQVGVAINTISGRYVEFQDEFYVPDTFRKQSKNNKQGSEGIVDDPAGALHYYEQSIESSFQLYKKLISMGVCKEQARGILPQALYTEFYMSASLQAWAHFLELRLDSHAQWEIREYAKVIKDILTPLFPVSLDALVKSE